MVKKILFIWAGILGGIFLAYFLVTKTNILNLGNKDSSIADIIKPPKKVVIGFLPYWLISKAQEDYSNYITQLSYFSLTIDSDGSIQKYTKPGESDPGYHALFTGKVDDFLAREKAKGLDLSLTIFSGDDATIDSFLENPASSAQNLVSDITPLITQYGFDDINLDIEKVSVASPEARLHYATFVSEVRKLLHPDITLTVDLTCISFVKDTYLVNPKALAQSADYLVVMGYDFHNPGSFVTGPVAPQDGAGIVSEFDIASAISAALTQVPANKLILAIPLYGYSWETINPVPRSAIMPGSAYSISSKSVADLLAECATCSAEFDTTDKENHIIYQDIDSGLYHQIFYPDIKSTQAKVNFAKQENLAGMALWALGYEDNSILQPLAGYFH